VDNNNIRLTHIAGTFLIQADGAFLNGAGLGDGEDRNVTIPKTFQNGRFQIPYVSAQAWKRWLRNTAVAEAGWPVSDPKAIGWNPRGNVNKIAPQLNPVDFPEDDIFGYMRTQEGQGRRRDSAEIGEEDNEEADDMKTKAVMRASPFAASLLTSLRSTGWRGNDEGFVHLTKYEPTALAEAEIERFLETVGGRQDRKKAASIRLQEFNKELADNVKLALAQSDLQEVRSLLRSNAEALKESGRLEKDVNFIENATSPLPYTTRFYNTHLQAIFCLDFSRLGVFWNVGDRIELEETSARRFLREGKIKNVTDEEPYKTVTESGKLGRIYQMADISNVRRERASVLIRALAVLRGGAKQAQFGTDVSPKVIILAGLSCGNPIFNHLFNDLDGPICKVDMFKEIIKDYSDRIVTPVLVGIRTGYLKNEAEVLGLAGWYKVTKESTTGTSLDGPRHEKGSEGHWIQIMVTTPIDAALRIGDYLQ